MCQFNCNPWQTPNINPIPFAKILFFEKKKKFMTIKLQMALMASIME